MVLDGVACIGVEREGRGHASQKEEGQKQESAHASLTRADSVLLPASVGREGGAA